MLACYACYKLCLCCFLAIGSCRYVLSYEGFSAKRVHICLYTVTLLKDVSRRVRLKMSGNPSVRADIRYAFKNKEAELWPLRIHQRSAYGNLRYFCEGKRDGRGRSTFAWACSFREGRGAYQNCLISRKCSLFGGLEFGTKDASSYPAGNRVTQIVSIVHERATFSHVFKTLMGQLALLFFLERVARSPGLGCSSFIK